MHGTDIWWMVSPLAASSAMALLPGPSPDSAAFAIRGMCRVSAKGFLGMTRKHRTEAWCCPSRLGRDTPPTELPQMGKKRSSLGGELGTV